MLAIDLDIGDIVLKDGGDVDLECLVSRCARRKLDPSITVHGGAGSKASS